MKERTYLEGYEDGASEVMAKWITALDEVGLGFLSFEDAAQALIGGVPPKVEGKDDGPKV